MGQCRRHVGDEEIRVAMADEDNLRIMWAASRRYPSLSDDEKHSCFLTAMWRTLGYFDPSRGQKFTSSLTRFVRWECSKYAEKTRAANWAASRELDEKDYPNGPWAKPKAKEEQHLLELLSFLGNRDRRYFVEYYVQGYSLKEIAERAGTTKESVRQRLKWSVCFLKEIWQGEEYVKA